MFPTLDSGGFSSPGVAEQILAFIVFDRQFSPHTLDQLLTRLIPFRKPVAINQTLHALHSGRVREYPGHVHWFDLTHSPLHGRTLAEFLIEQGHRKVAYLSLGHAAEWSLKRLEGLCRGFEPFGGASCVVPYSG